MDATAHLIAGASVGSRLRPHWALLAGLLTHAVLDAIPHTNYTGWRPFSWLLLADAVFGAVAALLLSVRSGNLAGGLAGAVGGILPAVERQLSGQYEDFLARPPLYLPDTELGPPVGFVTQGLVIVLAVFLARVRPVYPTRQRGTSTVKRLKV